MAMEEGYLMLMDYVWSTGDEDNRNDFFGRKKLDGNVPLCWMA
jgi:hypothetical protein